jgi:hypothetical protein
MSRVEVVISAETANAMHAALAADMDSSMRCDFVHDFPPAAVVSAALERRDLTLYAVYDEHDIIAGAIVVTGSSHPKFGCVFWFYAAAGRHDDAVAALAPRLVADVGMPRGVVQNPEVRATLQRVLGADAVIDGTHLSWGG